MNTGWKGAENTRSEQSLYVWVIFQPHAETFCFWLPSEDPPPPTTTTTAPVCGPSHCPPAPSRHLPPSSSFILFSHIYSCRVCAVPHAGITTRGSLIHLCGQCLHSALARSLSLSLPVVSHARSLTLARPHSFTRRLCCS